jgi:HEAT repeat protein
MTAPWLAVCVLLLLVARGEGAPAGDPGDEKLLREAGVAADGPGLLAFLRRRTFTAEDEKRAVALVGQLGDASYERRQQASEGLEALGPVAAPLLRRAVNDTDPEVRRRARACLEVVESGRDAVLAGAAVRLLAVRAPEGAPAALLRFLPWAGDEAVEEDVLLALAALSPPGRPHPVVVAARADPAPLCRAAAALVVGRAGTEAQRVAVKRLLADGDSRVRLRAAQGLLAARNKDGLPALLDLLTTGPEDVAGRAEGLLAEVAGAAAPRGHLGSDDRQRRACRDAWEGWWKAQGDKLDLAKLDADAVLFRPARRAATVARQFLDALIAGDPAAAGRTADVPFFVSGLKRFTTLAELEQFAREVHARAVDAKLSCRMRGTVAGEEFARTPRKGPGDKLPEGLPPWRELHAVYASIYKGDKKDVDEGVYLLVRVRGGRVRVIAVGNGTPPEDQRDVKPGR